MALLGEPREVTVLTVVAPPVLAGAAPVTGIEGVAVPMTSPEASAEIDEAATEEARAAIDQIVADLGVPAERLVVHGDPAYEICRVAGGDSFDVLVIGSHGAGFVKRVLLGSVSHHVMHHAPCPVLVVREQPETT